MAAKRPARKPQLTVEQIEIVGQFNDAAFEYPKLSFEQVAKKLLPKGFGAGPAGKKFREEAKAVFDQERAT